MKGEASLFSLLSFGVGFGILAGLAYEFFGRTEQDFIITMAFCIAMGVSAGLLLYFVPPFRGD